MATRKTERAFDSGHQIGARSRSADTRKTYDQRVDQILAAATEVFARDGYQKASMRAIASASDVSLAGLYHYFESKQRMLFVIQFRAFSSLRNNLQEKLHGIDDPIEQLRVMVKTHISYFVANMAALRVCSHEMESLSGSAYEETYKIRREYYDQVRAIVDRIIAREAPNSTIDQSIATMSLFGALNWLYQWYDPKKDRSPNVLANQLATQFLHGVLGAAGVPVDNWQESIGSKSAR